MFLVHGHPAKTGPWVAAVVLALSVGCARGDDRERALKKAELHYRLGHGSFQDNRPNDAIRELTLALEANPDHEPAHHLLGLLYMARRDYDLALEHLERAVRLDPRDLAAQNNLGTCYLSLCRWGDAERVFTALVGNPLYQTPHIAENNLGLALLDQGRIQESLPHFQRAVLLNPRFCVAFNNLGRALLELGRLEDARATLAKALDADPLCRDTYAEPHLHLGRLLERLGDPGAAMAEYARCVELVGDTLVVTGTCGRPPVGLRCKTKLRQLRALTGSAGGRRR